MEIIEMVECECCGLKEECTQEYIRGVEREFDGKWLCGLCSEAVKDEFIKKGKKQFVVVGEAITAHMTFCGKYNKSNNPATRVADGMKQLLRRRCRDFSHSSMYEEPKRKFGGQLTHSNVTHQ